MIFGWHIIIDQFDIWKFWVITIILKISIVFVSSNSNEWSFAARFCSFCVYQLFSSSVHIKKILLNLINTHGYVSILFDSHMYFLWCYCHWFSITSHQWYVFFIMLFGNSLINKLSLFHYFIQLFHKSSTLVTLLIPLSLKLCYIFNNLLFFVTS